MRLYHYAYSMKNMNRVTLQLEGELANVSLKHLKHSDLVYQFMYRVFWPLIIKSVQAVNGGIYFL